MKNWMNRLLALVLVVCTILGLGGIPAQAASIADGTQTCTVALGMRNNYLVTTAGTTLRAGDYTYTTNDGLSGPAYCIDHGLDYTDEVLPVAGKYAASPATAGAFANGYPQHSVDTFLGLYLKDNAVLAGLTEAEFAYATQVAVWATLGQLGVDGTPYTAGREYLNPPTGDTQQTRVFRAAQLILNIANTWDRVYQTGMYIRVSENALDGNVAIPPDMTLEHAANRERYGIKRELINGKPFYTKEYTFASATSTYYSDYSIELWADNAPEGTIFTALDNVELPQSNFRERATWRLPTEPHYGVGSQINNNGYEYWGKAKLCIPVDTATPKGEITINCASFVMQYEIFLANNEDYSEQSYILADPSKGTQMADAVLSWGSDITEQGYLKVTKVGGGGEPLSGAEFTLTGSDGNSRTGTTDSKGVIFWSDLRPDAAYTLAETKAPDGYARQEPRTVQITAGQVTYETVKDDPLRTLTVHKQDVQTNYSLRGATFCFEQIDGSYKTTKVTDHAGNIQLNADQLPLGSYKVYEVAAPEGYEMDRTAQTVNWDGKRDVTLTFTDTRKMTLILSKQDAYNRYNLPGASFKVYRDGQLVTTVTTNEAGLAYVPDVKAGYYEVKETVAPEGYTLNDKTYGIHIDPYDPATTDDPRLVIINEAMPSLRIMKYDRQSMKPLAEATFKVYKDTTLMGSYTTDRSGQILVTGLEPGIYTVQEENAPGTHIVDTTPQQVELTAGRTEPVALTFFNNLRPGLRLVKVDAADPGKLIHGAIFEIKAVNGGFGPKELTTDKNGEIDLSSLPTGAYVVTEKSCPGYVVDDAQRIVELKPNEDAEFVFTNSKLPTITLHKQDAQGQPMEGVAFSLTKMGTGAHADERTTNAQGVITWEALEPGLYSLVEVATKATHVLDATEHHVQLYPGKDAELLLTNQEKPSLKITKFDRQSGQPMSGVVFEVFKDTVSLGKHRTDNKGEILLSHVDPGTYKAVETDTGNDTHILVTTPQEVELHAGDGVRELVFVNEKLPGIHLIKVDGQTMKPLPGATYRIGMVGGSFEQEYVTDSKGEIDLSKLEPGTYAVTETKAPEGYLVDDGTRIIRLNAGENAQFVFTDSRFPSFTLHKQDTAGKPMEGVTFSLTKMGTGAHADERTTNAQGVITWEGLEPGLYSLVEIATKPTHVRDTTEHHVRIDPGKDAELLLVNEEKPSLKITKFDRQSGQPMNGVVFEVFKDTVSLGKHRTDNKGEILLDHVDPGTYKAVETDTGNDTHILVTTPQEVELRAGDGVRELTFFNDKLPGLHLVKVDSADLSKPIPDAKFRFTSIKGDYGPMELTTGTDGTIDLSKLPVGSYEVVELACPGYVVDKAQRLIHLDGNETGQFVFTNTLLPRLELTKQGADGKPLEGVTYRIAYVQDGTHYMDKVTDKDGKIILEGLEPGVLSICETATLPNYILDPIEHHVELKVGQTATVELKNDRRPNLTIHKTDADTDEPVPGTTFVVKVPDGHSIAEVTTDKEGKVTVYNMLPGVYEVSEKSVPVPYLQDAPAQTVTLYANQDRDVTFANHKKPGLTINKLDSITGDPIQGVKFSVTYASNNTSTGEINDLGTFTTDANGQIYLDRLKDGWYNVTEQAPKSGYAIKNSATQECYIKAGSSKVLTFENTPLSALVVYKYDSITGAAIEGATFQVKYLAGSSGTGGTVIGTYKTSVNGSFTVTKLKAGTYVVEELASDENHVIDAAPQTAVISGEDQDVVQLYFGNAPKASLLVKKVDAATGKPLSDVEFMVTLADGSVVGDANGKYVTDNSGSFTISGLNPGTTLVVKETRAKEWYILDDAPQTITVRAGQSASLEFRNKPNGSVLVKKMDTVTGKPLSDVEFMVTLADGSVLGDSNGKYVTDSSGSFTISGLNPGTTLVVKETRAKEGYILDDAPQTITVRAGQSASLEFRNKPNGSVLVKKVDAVTGKPLSDVEFMVTTESGAVVGTANGKYVTDASGSFTIAGVSPGTTLIVRESRAKAGYILDDTPQTAVVQSGKIVTLEFRNMPKGALVIVKRDANTKKPLQGAEFQVTTSDGKYVDAQGGKVSSKGLYTTDKDGQIIITGLEPCTVVVTETKAPRGYVLDETPQTVAVNANDTQTLYFYDKPTPVGDLKVLKLDEETRQPIQGVEFSISRINGERLGLYRTNSKGIIYLEDLEPGWYTVQETKAAKDYRLDAEPKDIEVKNGKTATLEITNRLTGSALIHKVDSVTGKGIYGVTFLVSDAKGNPVGQYSSDQDGYVYVDGELADGKYTIREIQQAEGYLPDTTVKTFYVEYGGCSTITWYNTPVTGQIQVTKTSADYNPTNGWPAGTAIPDCEFEVYNKAGNLVDTIRTDKNGIAATRALPLGQYKVVESKAADFYALDNTPFYVELQFAGQIVRIAATNKSVTTGVSITKTGYKEVMPGQVERFTFSGIGNTSTVSLRDFYWRDSIPVGALRLSKVVTGTWNVPSSYKLVYLTNKSDGQYRTLADNLSTSKNYAIDASPVALGLANDEYVTEVMAIFGVVPAGFHQVEAPALDFTVVSWLPNGYQFTNQADVGGSYNGAWVQANTRWVTTVYAPTKPLPRTGY